MSIRRLMAAAGGLVIAVAAGLVCPLNAQGAPQDLNADSKFIRDAASANIMEIRLGQLAQKKATNPAVKQFGQQMVTDHTTMENQWTTLVSSNGMHFQPGMNQTHTQEVNSLEKVSGAEFDRAYMTSMIQNHENDVNSFQTAAQSAHSTQVRQRAANDLLTIQQHLNMARQVGSQVGVTSGVAVTAPTGQTTAPTGQSTSQSGAVTPNAQVSQDLKADSKFIREATADNTLEVQLGQLAETKASNPAVKQYAQRAVSEHTTMENQWTALAANGGMPIKPGMGRLHRQKLTSLQGLSGKDFDRAYMTTEIRDHKDYVDYFQKEGRAVHSAQVRDQAANDLLSHQQLLSQAKQVGSQVGADTVTTRAHVRATTAK